MDLSKVFFYILYKHIEEMQILQIGQVKKLHGALVFEQQEGQHSIDIIKSWHLVIHNLLS